MDSIREELPGRIERIRQMVRERDLAVLVVYGDAGNSGNVRYFTNYAPFFGPVVFILAASGENRLLLTFDWEVPRAQLASGLENIEAGYDIAAMLSAALQSLRIPSDAPLGLVGLNLIPHPTYMALASGRPEPVDMSGDLRQLRLIKSPLEQLMLHRAAAATDAALEALPSQVRAGMTEIEVASLIDSEMRKAGAQGFAFPSGVASGPNSEKPVSMPSSRQIQKGDLLMVDIGAMWEGYQADVSRTYVIGKPTERQREVHDAVRRAHEATMAMARPGVRMAELHRNVVRLLDEHGLARYFTHRAGHGIGLETSLEPIDLRRDEIEFRPGMTLCVEPGVYIPSFGGIKMEDDLIVTEGEPEIISHAPRELISI